MIRGRRPKPLADKHKSEEVINKQMPVEQQIEQDQIVIQQDRPEKVTANINPYMNPDFQQYQSNPYEQQHNPQQVQQSPYEQQPNSQGIRPKNHKNHGDPRQFQQNPYDQHPPQVIQDGNMMLINGAPQQVVIVNQVNHGSGGQAKTQQAPSWTRQARIGCCCISVHNNSYCCNIFCMDSFCRCIQHSNLCCYCHNLDCIYCCIHHACRTCCFEKEFCECVLECCKHMPLCLIIDCLKNGACGECLCNCIQNCHICQALKNCDCDCLKTIGEGICGIICCFFK